MTDNHPSDNGFPAPAFPGGRRSGAAPNPRAVLMARLRLGGATYEQIGARLGLTRQRVAKILSRFPDAHKGGLEPLKLEDE
jgi:hypothetical protein